ncbi:MAG: hypothetical protein QHH04_03460 [Methanolinea sp.]|nr:hypothetical protein [Methanolinea sp.]
MKTLSFLGLAITVLLVLAAGCIHSEKFSAAKTPAPATGNAEMTGALATVTAEIQESLIGIDSRVSAAATALGKTGISGPEAGVILQRAALSHPAVRDVITYDTGGVVRAAEPGSARDLVGRNLTDQEIVRKALQEQRPLMSDLFSLTGGGDGVVIAHPVFAQDGTFIGVVSLAFSPHALIAPIAGNATSGSPSSVMVTERGGRILYDADPAQVGKETFNETMFADFPEILDIARTLPGNRTGYATYSFSGSGSQKVVRKETFWSTASLHGTEWRVFVIREI